ncbi:UvrD-helicase domain-containing protein [Sediminibacterium sp.]|uniref:UvrD-helicase domain-containing protein n=1 Tax=Sediminibacterium sp. TaxID=1917865 RepID=UPI0027351DD8|nr:UvrD-helicase domain-containing protein [Sediminibacterium sp.]MDP3393067.1 UvrD-helicase domain-containing protein [Sediminibacterium sp.]MDP3567670.1 UvrD-helicase domain-containing protein [Sediminibacterium sp.]
MFDFKTLNITDEDIAFVENHFGFEFNEGQKKNIRYWDSTDIQACPGSDKTTTLAAKLIILANKIPKSFKQGVCVITHTNVAVAEIKSKLDSYSNFYFNYPNHFGTIQSVVDKFFTIPAYKNEFKSSPTIDNDSYYDMIERAKSREIEAAKSYLSRSKNIEFLGVLSFNKANFDVSDDVNETEPIVGKHTNSYNTLLELKNEILKKGYIKYEEAYSIAFKYLRENPQLKELFSKRFPLVFIDEMQDMETHQSELISYLCDGTSTIVQKIGDINQSIFNYSSSDKQNEWRPKINLDLQLTETTRISENIVQVVKDICIAPQVMTGWINPTPFNPTIILFDDNSILDVKDKFGELVIQNNLHKGKPCKAVGARLSDSRLNINSYWHEFNRGYNKRDFSNINSFLENAKNLSLQSKNVKEVRKSLLSIICKSLRLCKVKHPVTGFYFTPFALYQYLNSLDDLSFSKKINDNITKWITSISQTEILKREIETYVSDLLETLGGQVNDDLKQFFTNPELEATSEKVENRIYSFATNGQEVQIHFDTIHGVKGETHTATLYLETFNRVYDIGSKILEFIISTERQRTRQRANDAFRKRLPLGYVAMTRATHFICLAVHKDRYTENHKTYFDKSSEWNVIIL